MKKRFLAGVASLLVGTALLNAQAQDTTHLEPTKPPKYTLQLVHVAGTKTTECFRVIKEVPQVRHKSLSAPALKLWVKDQPTGTRIDYYSSCLIMGGEPTGKEIEEFKAYCKSVGVDFVFHPSG